MANEVLIFNLEKEPINLGEYLAGPWDEAKFVSMIPEESLAITSGEVEYSVFVSRGIGTLTLISGEEFELFPGSALAFPLPGAGIVVAGPEGLEALVVTVAIARN